jgi:MFS family permease
MTMNRRILVFFGLAVTALLFFTPLALAQEPVVLPNPDENIDGFAQLLWDAIMNKQWGLVASLVIMLAVAALRKWVPETTKVGAWFRSKVGGIVLNLSFTTAGAFATAFLSGHAITGPLVLKVLTVAFGASGGWAIIKNVLEALDERKAKQAGEAAASNPGSTLDK